jgi:hypothetical protein
MRFMFQYSSVLTILSIDKFIYSVRIQQMATSATADKFRSPLHELGVDGEFRHGGQAPGSGRQEPHP